ncbi:PAS domain S-box protein [Aquimarina algicola]|uniref:histidine kinase n=2 Tax=Aquimarina algicola TaxID=2589995 RepID=A0A504JLI3_9FLAO|nr:PAS domain S-box protein [Aquimarina algicola]
MTITKKTELASMKVNFHFPIIAIGSSAGGLRALETFFEHCPSNTGFAFVVIQHLSPDYKSLMPELLSRHTDMVVKEAIQNEKIQPNHVYLIPGDKNIVIHDKCLQLTQRAPLHQVNFSVDTFFKSLSLEKKEKSICCILSGTGSDGTKGAKSIKEMGGAVFVQSPDDAKFDGMPNSVISQGLADFILPVEEIPKELIHFIKHDQLNINALQGDPKDTQALKNILQIIHDATELNFLHYKKPTLFRRTIKRMNICKQRTFTAYINYLKEDPDEKFLLAKEFLIGVTKFFRDQKAFDELREKVIPQIVDAKHKSGESIKVWVVACSTGEEPYSLAILIEEYLSKTQKEVDYKIFATDINDEAIHFASKGFYKKNIIAEMPKSFLDKYFIEKEKGYQINAVIRHKIIFSKHDILQNPPFGKIDLVSCRNMLIYMENDIQLKALNSIHFSLNQYGYLFLGSSESVSFLEENLEEISSKWKIYKNIKVNRLLPDHNNEVVRVRRKKDSSIRINRKKDKTFQTAIKAINSMLIEELDLVFACIDEHFEIIQASGKLKDFIAIPEEGFTNNLIKMLPDELSIPITTLIRKLNNGEEKKATRNVKWLIENILKEIKLTVKEIKLGNDLAESSTVYIVLFQVQESIEVTHTQDPLYSSEFDQNSRVEELKEALNETRENLQSTIEELETTNEEMQATNEELIASNEELQSTNEELQSLNEELHTVNTELQQKNIQLLESNSDIENLIKNVNIGTVFLDRTFNIRKFTPAIRQHFQLRVEDIGRPISHFSGTLGGQDLMKLSARVIDTLQSYKQEVQNTEGVWFLMQIFPYLNQEHVIKGVVINFINIDDTKAALQETAKLNTFLSRVIDTNPGIIYIYDLIEKRNVYASDNVAKIAGYTEEEIKGLKSSLLDILIHPEDIERIGEHHQKMKYLKDGEVLSLEYRLIHKDTKKPIWILSTDKVNERNTKGEVVSILGVSQDISQTKDLEDMLRISESRLQLAIKGNRAAIWEWSDFSLDKAWWSDEFYKLLGYSSRDLKHEFTSFLNLIHEDQISHFKNDVEKHINELTDFEDEIRIKTKRNGYKWFRVNAKAQKTTGCKIKIVGTLADINYKKEAENRMKDLNVELERFAYLASHDLKEPLRTISSFTKLFKDEYHENFDATAIQYLDFIEKASARMIVLTNDLLQYSQLDNKSLKFETVRLNEILKEIVQDLQKPIEDNYATITIDVLPSIFCDKIQIRQLFQNLISNSIKYRKKEVNPRIEIGCEEKSDHLQFYVKDNGIGINAKYHAKIFEVFKRLHSQDEYEGTGIGLANCKRIIDNHKGKIWLQSSLEKGAVFYFSIPKIESHKKDEKDKLYTAS